jgi:lipoprotein-releasing system ATP-binding protein
MSDTLVLSAEHIHKDYETAAGPMQILENVSLVMSASETVAIVGPSGSGKSTLLNIIGSLDKPTSGAVRLGDIDVTSLYDFELAAYRSKSVGFIFQDHHLLPQLTAIENVMLPMLALGGSADAARAEELLRLVGLSTRMHALPARMSGGERQRVAVARAMANDPPLLLCDEPTGNLDRKTGESIAQLFIELSRTHNVMLIVVTHNMDIAKRFQRCYELDGGQLRRMTV